MSDSRKVAVLQFCVKYVLISIVMFGGIYALTGPARSAGKVTFMALGGAVAFAVPCIYKYPKLPWQ